MEAVTHEAPSELLTGRSEDKENRDGTVQFLDLLEPEVTNLLTSETKAFKKGSSSREPHGNLKADFPSRPYDVDF